MKSLKVAAVQFDLKEIKTENAFWVRVENFCRRAAQQKVKVILFPEYFSLSLLLYFSKDNFSKALFSFSALEKPFHSRMAELAKKYKLFVVAGTVPVQVKKKLINRCYVYTPKGKRLAQDKINMTRFEDEAWGVQSGKNDYLVFSVEGVKFGIAICFDVEFPRYVERLIQKKIDILLVPSCTEDVHGYWRVRHCAEARAIEGQIYVVQSCIVGGNPKHSEIFPHFGQAVVVGPCDVGFPPGGCLVENEANRESILIASLDMNRLRHVQRKGSVLNRQLVFSSKG